MSASKSHQRITILKASLEALQQMDPTEAEQMLGIFEKMAINSLRQKTLGRRGHHRPEAA